MTDYTLAANTALQKLTYDGRVFVPHNLATVSTKAPYTYLGNTVSPVTASSEQWTEDMIIQTDETNLLYDANGNTFEYFVGSRPAHRPKQ